MRDRKQREIEELLEKIEQRLANAEEYLARNVKVEGRSFLHFRDWEGRSGHPSWMKGCMIPATKRWRTRKEQTLQRMEARARKKALTLRKRQGAKSKLDAEGIAAIRRRSFHSEGDDPVG